MCAKLKVKIPFNNNVVKTNSCVSIISLVPLTFIRLRDSSLCLIFRTLKTLVQNPFRAYNIFAFVFLCSTLQSYRLGNGLIFNPMYPTMSKYLYLKKLILHWIRPESLIRTFWRIIMRNELVTAKVLGTFSNNETIQEFISF